MNITNDEQLTIKSVEWLFFATSRFIEVVCFCLMRKNLDKKVPPNSYGIDNKYFRESTMYPIR